jgi:hypothetical protein
VRRGPLFVVLGVAAVVPAAASCTHTIDGTGNPDPGSSSTATTPAGACANIDGVWDVKGVLAHPCAEESCDIVQMGCEVSLDCFPGGTFDGTIDGTTLRWTGVGGTSCTGAIGPAGAHIDATCTGGPDNSCTLSATRN